MTVRQDNAGSQDGSQQQAHAERRRYARFGCAGAARIWENGTDYPVAGRLNEISMGGCYIETMSPTKLGTSIRLELAVCGRVIRLEAVVRASQAAFGMGVEFTRMDFAEAEKLHRVVAELSGEVSAIPTAETPPSADDKPDAFADKELIDAILRWFGAHDVLARGEFLHLLNIRGAPPDRARF